MICAGRAYSALHIYHPDVFVGLITFVIHRVTIGEYVAGSIPLANVGIIELGACEARDHVLERCFGFVAVPRELVEAAEPHEAVGRDRGVRVLLDRLAVRRLGRIEGFPSAFWKRVPMAGLWMMNPSL